jgi:hypothetical protein
MKESLLTSEMLTDLLKQGENFKLKFNAIYDGTFELEAGNMVLRSEYARELVINSVQLQEYEKGDLTIDVSRERNKQTYSRIEALIEAKKDEESIRSTMSDRARAAAMEQNDADSEEEGVSIKPKKINLDEIKQALKFNRRLKRYRKEGLITDDGTPTKNWKKFLKTASDKTLKKVYELYKWSFASKESALPEESKRKYKEKIEKVAKNDSVTWADTIGNLFKKTKTKKAAKPAEADVFGAMPTQDPFESGDENEDDESDTGPELTDDQKRDMEDEDNEEDDAEETEFTDAVIDLWETNYFKIDDISAPMQFFVANNAKKENLKPENIRFSLGGGIMRKATGEEETITKGFKKMYTLFKGDKDGFIAKAQEIDNDLQTEFLQYYNSTFFASSQ